ncbi:MAG: hypothetical protein IJW18_06045 [Lachnospiraceae bacterium]|nr:hypothetical protein [Lachnospiraceae bacterium]
MGEKDLMVLEEYDVEVLRTGKGRESIYCETADKGLMLLKEYEGSEGKAGAENAVLKELLKNRTVDVYMENKEGKCISVMPDGRKYILKKGVEGREIDLKSAEEMYFAVRALANLHNELAEITDRIGEEITILDRKRSFDEDILRHHKELKRVKNYIRNQRRKNDFELKVMECFDIFYEQDNYVIEYAEAISGEIAEDAKRLLCHGNFNQHNALLSGKEVNIINFDKMNIFYQITDLYFFMRKCMEKQNFDVGLGLRIIEEYEAEKRLAAVEKKMLYVMFSYPEKFWKVLNHYYNANKAWISQKSIDKLEVLIKQEALRQGFLRELCRL